MNLIKKAGLSLAAALGALACSTPVAIDTPEVGSGVANVSGMGPILLEERKTGLLSTDVMLREWRESKGWNRDPSRDQQLAFPTTEVPGSWEGDFGMTFEPIGSFEEEGRTIPLTHVVEYNLQTENRSRSWNDTRSEEREATLGQLNAVSARIPDSFRGIPGTVSLQVRQDGNLLLGKTMRVLPLVSEPFEDDILETTLPSGETWIIERYGMFKAISSALVKDTGSDPSTIVFLDELHHQGTTSEIPLDKDVWFGFYFKVVNTDRQSGIPYVVKVHHPEFYNPSSDRRLTMRSWTLPTYSGSYGQALDRNGRPFTRVPGTRRFEVWVEDQLVLRKSFEVYPTGHTR